MPENAPPPPPPPVVPVASPAAAQAAVGEARQRLDRTLARAATFTEDQRQQRVDDEWSTVESLRHLVLVIDLWLSKAVLGEADPFDPMALPPTFVPTGALGPTIDPAARPSFEEASAVIGSRMDALAAYAEGVSDDELARPIQAHAGTVGGALSVIFTELAAHDSFIHRDLDRLVG